MAKINYLDSKSGIARIAEKYTLADEAVEAALKKYIAQLKLLEKMADPTSEDGQLIVNTIETAELAENDGDAAWITAKSSAKHTRDEIEARFLKYQSALAPITALREE